MNNIYEICNKIVTCLQNEDYDFLNEHNALCRVSEEDIKRVIYEYGGHLSSIPNLADDMCMYMYNDKSGMKIDLDLWIGGKRSDLTLQVEIKFDEDDRINSYRILDLLVM